MDEFRDEDGGVEEEYGEEMEEIIEEAEAETEEDAQQSEAQRAEAADLAKLVRQHPEIWIPYEDQVLDQLNTSAPTASETALPAVSYRDLMTIDPKHTTYPFLTNYERTKCISFRASQIASGAHPYVLVPEGVTDAYEIAKMELESKRLPFIIKRPLPDGSFEVWRLSDLVIF
jgi:DNA-directed RNA polymerase I, II, and III subunit RPABC2